MDIFHAITSEIENVISCHWLDEFRTSHRSQTNTPKGPRSQSAAPISRSHSSTSVPRSGSAASLSRRSSSNSIASQARSHSEDEMSSNMMDTEPGGENTQYESIKTVTEPSNKQSGQLGGEFDL